MTKLVKYPRTYHLPWSENISKDDRVLRSINIFKNQRVIVTEKMDGENTTLYNDYYHARSVLSNHHHSQDWIKNFHSKIKHKIGQDYRICGENLYAVHSIHYENLLSYFLGFSVWHYTINNTCIDWDSTIYYFNKLGIISVPMLYDGIFNREIIHKTWQLSTKSNSEGYVIRLASAIDYHEFENKVGKFVRKRFITTDKHWKHGQIIKNQLK